MIDMWEGDTDEIHFAYIYVYVNAKMTKMRRSLHVLFIYIPTTGVLTLYGYDMLQGKSTRSGILDALLEKFQIQL